MLELLNFARKNKVYLFVILDITCAIFATLISFYIRYDFNFTFLEFILNPILFSFSFLIFFLYFRIYNFYTRYIGIKSVRNFFNSFILYFFTYLALTFYLAPLGVPRSIGVLQPIIFSLLIYLNRITIKNFLEILNSNLKIKNAIIYSDHKNASEYINRLSEFRVLAVVNNDKNLSNNSIDGVPIVNINRLDKIFRKYLVDKIFIILKNNEMHNRKFYRSIFANFNKDISFLPSIQGVIHGDYSINELNSIQLEDLIDRKIIWNKNHIKSFLINKKILITGAGGSIGSELSKQILSCSPFEVLLLDNNEFNLYNILNEIGLNDSEIKDKNIFPILTSLNEYEIISKIIFDHKPDIIFHAAAYKHVPILETNVISAVKNNIFASEHLINEAIKNNVENFVLISSDKAVRPTNIMGSTKRFVEMYMQSIIESKKNINTNFSAVRFGNVLGSNGSVVPLFNKQIDSGGPVTITHENITRYFMTIPEAVGLVLETCILNERASIYFLNMGDPIKVVDLAKKMIELKGKKIKEIDDDFGIGIKLIGLRPGEKLFEELLISGNEANTSHSDIKIAIERTLPFDTMQDLINQLKFNVNAHNINEIKALFKKTIEGFKS